MPLLIPNSQPISHPHPLPFGNYKFVLYVSWVFFCLINKFVSYFRFHVKTISFFFWVISLSITISGFYYGEICSLNSHFNKRFYHEWIKLDIKFYQLLFSALLKWYVFLSFPLLMYHTDLYILNHPCDHRMNSAWWWYMIFSVCCWIWFASILLRLLISILVKEIGL